MLQLLAVKYSATAVEVVPKGRLKRDATGKQLHELVKAGLALREDDATDARRLRFTLRPGLRAIQNADGHWEMDLGCCVLRWS